MAVTITAAAADKIRGSLASRGRGLGFRLGVKTSGCSGYTYTIDFVDEVSEDDCVFEGHGVKVFCR